MQDKAPKIVLIAGISIAAIICMRSIRPKSEIMMSGAVVEPSWSQPKIEKSLPTDGYECWESNYNDGPICFDTSKWNKPMELNGKVLYPLHCFWKPEGPECKRPVKK